MDFNFPTFLEFYSLTEKLKTATRHSWLSDSSRQESTAEHTWMLTLLALYLHKYIKEEIDLLKTLKMIIIHDLAEAITGDIPSFEVSKRKEDKYENELKAMRLIFSKIQDKEVAEDLFNIWNEYEKRESYESKFAKAIDKIDDILQHNVSDISTWQQGDFDMLLGGYDKHFQFDEFMVYIIYQLNKVIIEKTEKASATNRLKDNRMSSN